MATLGRKKKEISKEDKRVALITVANQGVGLQVAKELVANDLSVLVGFCNFARRGCGRSSVRAPSRSNSP